MPLLKRTQAQADPDALSGRTRSANKYLKRTADGQENEDPNEYYDTLTTAELRELCKARGKPTAGSRLSLLERLQEGERAGDSSENELDENFDQWFEDRMKFVDQRYEEAKAELRREGVSPTKLNRNTPQVVARAFGPETIKKAEEGDWPMRYHENSRAWLAEICKLRNLSTEGTRAELSERLQALDEKVHKHSKKYAETQKQNALKKSMAGKRAIEIQTSFEIDTETTPKRFEGQNAHCRRCKDVAMKLLEEEVSTIVANLQEEDARFSADIIGARLLSSRIPEWLARGGLPGYSKLRVGELRELLQLRQLDTTGMKPEMIGRLTSSDAYIKEMIQTSFALV